MQMVQKINNNNMISNIIEVIDGIHEMAIKINPIFKEGIIMQDTAHCFVGIKPVSSLPRILLTM
jgi:hypothetical protein